MAKSKNKYMSVFNIFFKGIKLYFTHIDLFLKYLAFPVLGQIAGLFLIFLITYVYSVNLPYLTANFAFFDNILTAMTTLLLFTIPAFFLFCKAFYDYLIAMAALNSMANNLTSKNKIFDVKMHDELIKRRALPYISLMIILSVIYLIGSIPFFWVLLVPFLVYSCLSLQVFTFEENTGPVEAIKRSFSLIKGNFWQCALLLVLLFLLTYYLLPEVISWAFNKVNLIYYFSIPVEKYLSLLRIDAFNDLLKHYNINYELEAYEMATSLIKGIVSLAVTSFTLPIRSACCTFFYKQLDDETIEENRKATKLDGRKELKKIIKKESN